uniref:Uncharacterized protein n=1 Tax=Clostridium botulinum TaxID=1491 RepID=A0A126JI43_CLOBO|nr:hypothetical protein [Clostridium botulinum]
MFLYIYYDTYTKHQYKFATSFCYLHLCLPYSLCYVQQKRQQQAHLDDFHQNQELL